MEIVLSGAGDIFHSVALITINVSTDRNTHLEARCVLFYIHFYIAAFKRFSVCLLYTSTGNKVYTGSVIKPVPAVKVGGRTLKNGTDFTVSYRCV